MFHPTSFTRIQPIDNQTNEKEKTMNQYDQQIRRGEQKRELDQNGTEKNTTISATNLISPSNTLPISDPLDKLPKHHHRVSSKTGSANSSPQSHSRKGSQTSSRRNSWVGEDGGKLSFEIVEQTKTLPTEITQVEVLSPYATVDILSPLPPNQATTKLKSSNSPPLQIQTTIPHMFASSEAEAKYSRMLRRASWPMLGGPDISLSTNSTEEETTQQQPSPLELHQESQTHSSKPIYYPTPATTPRKAEDVSLQGGIDSLDSFCTTFDLSKCSVKPSIPTPIVNILLLGDSTCGLGEALDEFAGRDRMIGISFKTRQVKVGSSHESRIRCWHTPSWHWSDVKQLRTLLRNIQGIFLIYDVTSLPSFMEAKSWFEVLNTYLNSHPEMAAKPRPILLIGNRAHLKVDDDLTADTIRLPASVSQPTTPTASAAASSQPPTRVIQRRSSLPPSHHQLLEEHLPPIDHVEHGPVAPTSFRRQVSPVLIQQLLKQMRTSYPCGASDAIEINANQWRERYRAFTKMAKMAQESGALASTANSANPSRTVSPIQEQLSRGIELSPDTLIDQLLATDELDLP